MRTLTDLLSGGYEFDTRLLQAAPVALKLVFISEETREVIDVNGGVAAWLGASVGDHLLENRTAIVHAATTGFDISVSDFVPCGRSRPRDATLLLCEGSFVLSLTAGAHTDVSTRWKGRRRFSHHSSPPRSRPLVLQAAILPRQAREGKSRREHRSPASGPMQ